MAQSDQDCLNCRRSSSVVPLLRLSYQERELWICPQCLPILIHKPERLAAVAGEWTRASVQFEHNE